ncbi:hypothetical protein F7725_017495 [Dissostichus mawsoni]|uniref:FAM65 N-terminal domain-containing protein n=1 Tax=Dissostichus mawsoni TaxID=36200 RepID=A0A7J5Z4L0_DISMA|nr:hypothetical protein F7725_017495 [Dissostichus mawsoni]
MVMSVKLRFDSPSDGGLVNRSRSFTGFSSLSGRRQSSSVRNSLRSKANSGGKSPRMQLSPAEGELSGLCSRRRWRLSSSRCAEDSSMDYLEGHQAEMDFLSSQQRETKRNSRLAFLYDLEKEIRALERYIRRLEFQLSKVEELYETYCIQWRLCQGAVNMKRAFSLSPSTRASRDSLLELSRNHTLSLQVVVRLGRQRWKIRGRIESDDTQAWDEEEMVFLPHIQHNFEIKVTEAKGLGWLLVGMVTPFDSSEKMRPLSVSRQSVSSRKSSVYSWTAPSTPSFTEKYFISMMRELQDPEGSLPSLVSKSRHNRGGVSLLSYLSHPSHTGTPNHSQQSPYSRMRAHSYPSSYSQGTSLGGSQTQLSFEEEESLEVSTEEGETREEKDEEEEWESVLDTSSIPAQSKAGSLLALQRSSTPDILRKNTAGEADPEKHGAALGQDTVSAQDSSQCQSYSVPASPTSPSQPPVTPPSSPLAAAPSPGGLGGSGAQRRAQANDLSLLRSSSTEETLAVEEVLESFDFLSNDFNADDDTSCLGSLRLKNSGISSLQQSTAKSLGFQSTSEEELVVTPLTSGNWGLDQALENDNNHDFGPSRRELLEEMSLQAEVLDRISCLLLEKNDSLCARDILPKTQRTRAVLLFWEECVTDSSSPFCCLSDTFSKTLKKHYTHKVKAKQPRQSEKAPAAGAHSLSDGAQPRPLCSPERVSLFQLSVYLKRWSILELGEHISRLSKEEYILSALRSPKRRRALNKMRGRGITELLPLKCTLQTLAVLQLDSNHKAVVYYTESLKSTDVQIQQGSCLALKCLRATESVDYIADVWKSTDEDLRSAAKETVLSFGKKGYLAFQRMDQLYTEMQEEAYQNQETEITFL